MADLGRIRDDMRAAGVWVFAGPLHPPSSVTVVRSISDGVLVTDGPYLEGHEHVAGFAVIDVPALPSMSRSRCATTSLSDDSSSGAARP